MIFGMAHDLPDALLGAITSEVAAVAARADDPWPAAGSQAAS
jgi:hypothetical protein